MSTGDSTATRYAVPGMSCDHCRNAIEAEVGAVNGVASVAVDLDAKIVTVTPSPDAPPPDELDDAVRAAIDLAGYAVA